MITARDTVRDALAHAQTIRPRVGGFPYLAETLRQAGVNRIDVTVPGADTIYVLNRAAVAQQGSILRAVPPFDQDALVAALRADQAGHTTYAEFVAASAAAGVVTYTVDLPARTCTYRGAGGEQYVERYAAVEIEAVPR